MDLTKITQQDPIYRHILVVCREEGDDEDSTYLYQNMTRQEAITQAEEECMHYPQSNEFYVNGIFTSYSPIERI